VGAASKTKQVAQGKEQAAARQQLDISTSTKKHSCTSQQRTPLLHQVPVTHEMRCKQGQQQDAGGPMQGTVCRLQAAGNFACLEEHLLRPSGKPHGLLLLLLLLLLRGWQVTTCSQCSHGTHAGCAAVRGSIQQRGSQTEVRNLGHLHTQPIKNSKLTVKPPASQKVNRASNTGNTRFTVHNHSQRSVPAQGPTPWPPAHTAPHQIRSDYSK
jgi:hypothetical protein